MKDLKDSLRQQAAEILRENDRGTYTVPSRRLYPFQWNWDSCLTALGFACLGTPASFARAWQELTTLFQHQWADGMVPHIIFHKEDPGYFPGPSVWGTSSRAPLASSGVMTSGLTQPPVAGFVLWRLFQRAQAMGTPSPSPSPSPDARAIRSHALEQAAALVPLVFAWHEWFYRCRDPEDTGLVAILHPWESGRDNAVDWDLPLSRVPTEGVAPFTRRDTEHADPSHRPSQEQYKRYLWLIEHFRSLGWDNTVLHERSPFRLVDPGFNAILARSCEALGDLAAELGHADIALESRTQAARTRKALETLWSSQHGRYFCYDRAARRAIEVYSITGFQPLFCGVPAEPTARLVSTLEAFARRGAFFLVPSHAPEDEASFDAVRYWRGPVWLIMNFLLAEGLSRSGASPSLVGRLVSDSLTLVEKSGFAEYYHPGTGAPCGGERFTWTAAMVLEFLDWAEGGSLRRS